MGQTRLDGFARLFVMPQAGHGLSGRNYGFDGNGNPIPVAAIPNTFDRFRLLADWVERKTAPGKSVVVTAADRTLPLCSYPTYPAYIGGSATAAASYRCR
jgi:feruloyl esterase